MAITIVHILALFCLINKELVSGLKIFATSHVTYGQDYLYLQFRIVKTASMSTATKLTVDRNVSKIFSKLLETNFENITWNDTDMEERSCSETSNNPCAVVLDIQLPTNKVNCTDTGMYRGHVEFVDGSSATDQVYIEVKVVPDSIDPIKLLSGQNASIPFPVDTELVLQCYGHIGDPPKDIHWCIQHSSDEDPKVYDNNGDITKGKMVLEGCQYTQLSNLTYVVSDKDKSTTLRCYAGDGGQCSNMHVPHADFKVRKATVNSGNTVEKLKMYLLFVLVIMLKM